MAKSRKSKDDGIELSPRHGLNPMLTTCFWCGESTGVALIGRIRKAGDDDAEAPQRSCVSLEPCDKCRKNFEKGVLIIEVTEDGSQFGNNGRFSLGAKDGPQRLWPTGRYAVLKPEAVKDGKPGGKRLCPPDVMDMILGTGGAKAGKAEAEPGQEGAGK